MTNFVDPLMFPVLAHTLKYLLMSLQTEALSWSSPPNKCGHQLFRNTRNTWSVHGCWSILSCMHWTENAASFYHIPEFTLQQSQAPQHQLSLQPRQTRFHNAWPGVAVWGGFTASQHEPKGGHYSTQASRGKMFRLEHVGNYIFFQHFPYQTWDFSFQIKDDKDVESDPWRWERGPSRGRQWHAALPGGPREGPEQEWGVTHGVGG